MRGLIPKLTSAAPWLATACLLGTWLLAARPSWIQPLLLVKYSAKPPAEVEVVLSERAPAVAGFDPQPRLIGKGDIDTGGVGSELIAERGTSLALTGWVALRDARRLRAIEIFSDGVLAAEVTSFYARPPARFRLSPSTLALGEWRVAINVKDTMPGLHSLTLRAKFADGATFDLGSHSMTVVD